jgi:hypothetical protein
MKRRILLFVLALILVGSLLGGVMRARAAGSSDKPTIKVIVVLKARGDANEVVGKLARHHAASVHRYRYFSAVAATVSQSTLRALLKDGNVLDVVSDHKVPAPKVPSIGTKAIKAAAAAGGTAAAPFESEALQLTHAQDAWKITVKGKPVMGQGIRVGMLDTGTDPTHPDLANAIAAYRDFTGNGLQDNDGHGTGTSSCVAAQGKLVYNNETGTLMRVAGMAPRAKVLMAKVIDVGGGWDSNIMRGIDWLISQKVNIISCSLGATYIPPNGADPSSLAFQAAIDHGITVVNSEGNEGPGPGTEGSSPDLKNLIAVGATTGYRLFSQVGYLASGDAYKGDQVITWTSRGPNSLGDFRPDIMGFGAWGWALAPTGQDVYGDPPGDVYGDFGTQEFGGTSMACPVVAGDLALAESAWKMKHPGSALPAPSYWKNLLASTATYLGYPALDQSTGLVNAAAAVREVVKQGKSFLASVGADPKNACSWSVKTAARTTIAVKNTGAKTERVTLTPTTFANFKTIVHAPITLTDPDYTDSENFTVPAGADFVQARITWPSGPDVSLQSAVYDSDGNFVAYGETGGGYGHLSFDQISLIGPSSQRPVVTKGKPWEIDIYPRNGFAPTTPQTVHLEVTFMRRVRATSIALSSKSVTLKPGATANVRASITAPQAAGTSFHGIEVSNGASTTTIPIAVRVPVELTNGHGTFGGAIRGSTVEYSGGEFYFYDFKVPAGTKSITASMQWPRTGNLVDLYLIDPSGNLRDAKGGDLVWYPDYSYGEVPDSAFTHTSEQVIWNAPQAGTWQVLVWAAGFDGNSFAEPYAGSITLDTPVVAPTSWTATAPPGGTASGDFTVTNAGATALSAYAESQAMSDGTALYDDVALEPVTGTLTADPYATPPLDGVSPSFSFTLPQNVALVTATATWSGTDTLVDMGLYDPSQTDKADSLAMTSLGNAVVVENPMAGLWSVILGYGNPAPPVPDADYSVTVAYAAPTAIDGFTPSATFDTPLVVAAGDSGTIHVTIDVPDDAQVGDVITGTLYFSTVGDGTEAEGGDHLGSVPVTITVAPPV